MSSTSFFYLPITKQKLKICKQIAACEKLPKPTDLYFLKSWNDLELKQNKNLLKVHHIFNRI